MHGPLRLFKLKTFFRYFVDSEPIWGKTSTSSKELIDRSIAQYTGGIIQVQFKKSIILIQNLTNLIGSIPFSYKIIYSEK